MKFNKSMSSVLVFSLLSSTCLGGHEKELTPHPVSTTVSVKPYCDPLPADNQIIHSALSTPVHSLMNLAPLYQLGLSGKGQVAGVIEGGVPIYSPASLQSNIAFSTETNEKKDHPSMVAQVVASQDKTVGLAPGVKIIFGTDQSKMDNQIAVTLEDAVKIAIRHGAKALNFSFKQFGTRLKKKGTEEEKAAHHDFTSAIGYALKQQVPVFISGGNDKEDFETTQVLKDILKWSSRHGEDLLVIATGFDYPEDVSSREDIFFAEHSARVNTDKTHTKKFALAGPYKVKALRYKSVDDRKKDLLNFRKHIDAEDYREMWFHDLWSFLDNPSQDMAGKDVSVIREKLQRLGRLFKEDKSLLLTSEDCEFFLNQSKRPDLPGRITSQIKKLGENLLSLYIDLLTSDMTSPASVPLEEQRRLEEKRRNIKLYATANYDRAKINGEFEKDIMDVDESGKPAQHSFSLETIQGTSFASPALMSVFLLLNEYNEQEGMLLQANDIIRCIRATGWQKLYANDSESLSWYGCGVVDGGKALEACRMLINARKNHMAGRFEESLEEWKMFLTALSQHANGKYILEIAETFRSQNVTKAPGTLDKKRDIEGFYNSFLKYYAYESESEFQDRLQAFVLYELGDYEKSRDVLHAIFNNNQDKDFARDSVELALSSILKKNKPSLLKPFITALKEFEGWYNDFTTAELKEVSSHTYPDGKTVFLESSRKMGTGLPLNIREGGKILNNLLEEIDKGWSRFESLNLTTNVDDIFDRIEGEKFLSTILTLPKKLEPFTLTSGQREQLAIHMTHAEQERAKFEEKTGKTIYLPR